ncbi:MAG: transposase [Dongiaceae bacterium]
MAKEIIDFRLAHSESAAEWERFLGDLIGRGLGLKGLEMVCIDGGSGLRAALPTALPGVPCPALLGLQDPQRAGQGPPCRSGRRQDRPSAILNARTLPLARSAARRFANKWQQDYQPPSPACMQTSTSSSPAGATNPSTADEPSNHKRHRAPLPRGQAPNQTHGRLLRPNLHGSHPLRRLQSRKPKPGHQHPLLLTQTS